MKKAKITDYQPNPENHNQSSERGAGMIEYSFRELGAGRSIVVDRNGVIIAGNQSQEGALNAGIEDVIEVETDGKQLVVVRRKDLDLSDKTGKARKLAYADNRTHEVSFTLDIPQMKLDLDSGLDLSGLYTASELGDLLGVENETSEAPEAQIDRADELREKWQTECGQLWLIPSKTGNSVHRLLCGDSTNADDVARVMGGEKPRLMVTDPPYGVEYDPEWRNELFGNGDRATGKVSNDDESAWNKTWELSPSVIAYCWHAGLHASSVESALKQASFEIRAQIIWSKPHFVVGRGHYHTRHEPCWYAVRKGNQAFWVGDSNEQTIWDIHLDEKALGGHSTQKPLECMARPIRNHEGDVYDPFLGSGTTMVASEQLKRVCYGIEIEPKYVAVILERMAAMGCEPYLEDEKAP